MGAVRSERSEGAPVFIKIHKMLRLYSRVLPVFGLAGNRRASPSHALRSTQKWSVNNQRVTHLCKHLAHLIMVWVSIVILFFFLF